MIPDQAELLRLLRYEAETGRLFWRERVGNRAFNSQFAGTLALNCPTNKGYLHGTIHDRRYRAHRVIVCMVLGFWPVEVDHENGQTADNRWINLKPVTSAQQACNRKRRVDNSSGITGVGWHAVAGKWVARIGKTYIGIFATIEEAAAARKAKTNELGYHPNHGRTAAERAAASPR